MTTDQTHFSSYSRDTLNLSSENAHTLQLALGNRYVEGNNPVGGYLKQHLHRAVVELAQMLKLDNAPMQIQCHRETESGRLYVHVQSGDGAVSFMVGGYPACCGSWLLHSFSHSGSSKTLIERLFLYAWVFATNIGVMAGNHWASSRSRIVNQRHRFNAILVSGVDQYDYPQELYTLDTTVDDAAKMRQGVDNRRYPYFHDFCKKTSTLNGSVLFYNVNSGNLCETVVVVPPSIEEFLKNERSVK